MTEEERAGKLRAIGARFYDLQEESIALRRRLREIEIEERCLKGQESNLIGGGWGA